MTLHHIMLVVLAVLVVLLVVTIVQLWRWSRVVRGWEQTWRDRARDAHKRAAEIRATPSPSEAERDGGQG